MVIDVFTKNWNQTPVFEMHQAAGEEQRRLKRKVSQKELVAKDCSWLTLC